MFLFSKVALICAAILVAECAGKPASGSYQVGTLKCKWTETGKSGPGKRGIRFSSCKLDNKPLKRSCEYFGGNPHTPDCADYYIKHVIKYYEMLANDAMRNGADPCEKKSIKEPKCNKYYDCESGDCLQGVFENLENIFQVV